MTTRYYAKLTGNVVGIDECIRFEAESYDDASEFANQQAQSNWESYGFDDNEDNEIDDQQWDYSLEIYNPEIHDVYFEHLKGHDDPEKWEITII